VLLVFVTNFFNVKVVSSLLVMILRTLSVLLILFNSLSFSKLMYISYLVFNAIKIVCVSVNNEINDSDDSDDSNTNLLIVSVVLVLMS